MRSVRGRTKTRMRPLRASNRTKSDSAEMKLAANGAKQDWTEIRTGTGMELGRPFGHAGIFQPCWDVEEEGKRGQCGRCRSLGMNHNRRAAPVECGVGQIDVRQN